MIGWLERILTSRRRNTATEAAHDVRLSKAQDELVDLRGRADSALNTLNERHGRNHYREAVTEIITGVRA